MHKVGNAKIAFIGLTFEDTPTVVTPSAVDGLEFRDEVATVNALVEQAAQRTGRQGVRRAAAPGRHPAPAGAAGRSRATPTGDEYTDVNGCVNFNGPEIEAIAAGLDPRVGVIVSAHTHQPYICTMSGKLVTSAASFGRVVTDIDLTIDHQSKGITAATADNKIVTQDVPQDPAAKAILDKYTTLSAPLANKVIGSITADIRSARDTPTGQNAAGEQPMGDVIADAMLEATTPTDFGGAVAAFMNSGGVRARPAVQSDQRRRAARRGHLRGGLHRAAVRQHAGGQDLHRPADLRRAQPAVQQPGPGSNRIMLPSANVHYQWTSTGAPHVVDGTVSFDGGAVHQQGRVLPGRHEQLHGRRRRQLHGLPLVHRAARRRSRPRRVRALPRGALAGAAAGAGPHHAESADGRERGGQGSSLPAAARRAQSAAGDSRAQPPRARALRTADRRPLAGPACVARGRAGCRHARGPAQRERGPDT